MNVLISGGFGFIGSYMTNNFLKKGYRVGIITKRVPSYFKDFSQKIDLYLLDITKPLKQKLRKKYDIFVHLAAANDVESSDTLEALKINTLGTKYCLDFCVDSKINKFIYFSTFQVYGTYNGFINEDTVLCCKNDYALTHMFAEEYVKMYYRQHAIDYIILRPTNIYGAPLDKKIDRWSLVPNCFCKEAFENGIVNLYTSGKQIRDFISLEDVCNITSVLCYNFKNKKNNIINLSSGNKFSILHVAIITKKIYEKLFNRKCILKINCNKPKKSEYFSISIDKIKDLKYIFSKQNILEKEIEKIFLLLKDG